MSNFRIRSINSAAAVLIGSMVLTIGCTGGSSSMPQVSNLRGVLTLYTVAERELGRAPQSEEEFKKFIQDRGGQVLERLDVQTVDELFISGRDGKPYVVIYGPPPNKEAAGIVAYDSEGIDGVREIAYQTGEIRELNAEQFAALGL